MPQLRLKFLVILTGCLTITQSSSPRCPLPSDAKTGHQSSVHITVNLCYAQTVNATPVNDCFLPLSDVTLQKDVVKDLDYDINNYALLGKFYGRDICVSYRDRILSKRPGRPTENRTSCRSDCFTGDKLVDIEYDYACDQASNCLADIQKLQFVVKSGSHRFQYELCLVLLAWLINSHVSL